MTIIINAGFVIYGLLNAASRRAAERENNKLRIQKMEDKILSDLNRATPEEREEIMAQLWDSVTEILLNESASVEKQAAALTLMMNLEKQGYKPPEIKLSVPKD